MKRKFNDCEHSYSINKTNHHLSFQIIEHEKKHMMLEIQGLATGHDIAEKLLTPWLGTGHDIAKKLLSWR